MAAPQSIAVIGLGYIGLPTAVVLAQRGTRVFGVDVDQRKVTEVNEGRLPFVEPGLGEALAEVVGNGTLTASTDTPKAEAYVVAVPTPFQPDHSADLSYVLAAARNIAPNLEDGNLVVLESTSPPHPLLLLVELEQTGSCNLICSNQKHFVLDYYPSLDCHCNT